MPQRNAEKAYGSNGKRECSKNKGKTKKIRKVAVEEGANMQASACQRYAAISN